MILRNALIQSHGIQPDGVNMTEVVEIEEYLNMTEQQKSQTDVGPIDNKPGGSNSGSGAYFSADYCSRLHTTIIKLNEEILRMSQLAAEQHAMSISDKWRIAGLQLELDTLRAQIFKRRSTDLPQYTRA